MSNSMLARPKSPSSDIVTSASGSISPQKPFRMITGLVEFSSAQTLLAISERTNNGIVVPMIAVLVACSSAQTLRIMSARTHNGINEEKLNRLLGVIRYIDRGNASLNCKLLLSPNADGKLPLDQLIAGEYDKVRENIGRDNPPKKPQLTPLSKEEQLARKPLPPEVLIDALQDPIHSDVGHSRPAKVLRSRQNRSGKQSG